MKNDLEEAVLKDLGRCKEFTELGEIGGCVATCESFTSHLSEYAGDEYLDPPLIFSPTSATIRKEPLGVALIMGSWNFPYFVCLKPLANAIATGNCAIIKPSELGPGSAQAI